MKTDKYHIRFFRVGDYTTADCSDFNFYKGVQVHYNTQEPKTIYPKMDGKAESVVK